MSTVEKTRSRVSERSWVKAQRKEVAKAYRTPNRQVSHYDSLYWAAHHRKRMEEHKREMLNSVGPNIIKIYFDAYIYQRIEYKKEVYRAKKWNKPFPLP